MKRSKFLVNRKGFHHDHTEDANPNMYGCKKFYFTAALLFIAGILVWRFIDEQFVPRPTKMEKQKGIVGDRVRVLLT